MSRGGWTIPRCAMRWPRRTAFFIRRTIMRLMTIQPTDTTISKTHATVRAGSLKSSPIWSAV